MKNGCRWFACAVIMALALATRADDWPQWRGPTLDGHSTETGIPVTWSATDNVAWRVAVPGTGHSSPTVFGDRVFLTTCVEHDLKRQLLCLDRRDGHTLWVRDVMSAPLEKKHKLNNYASSTAATDGHRVFVTFLDYTESLAPIVRVFAYDVEGTKLWEVSPGQFKSQHGWGASPILYKDVVIINGDQDAPAYLVALEQATGKERWRVDRPNKTRSYCTPLIVKTHDGRTQMVLTGSKSTTSYDPDTGRQYWYMDGPTEQFVGSPVYTDETVVVTGGFPTFHLVGIDPICSGTLTEGHGVLWHYKGPAASYVPSLIADGKYAFCVSDEGKASCIEAKTGKFVWSQKLGVHHRPSPVWAEGRLYYTADDATTYVLKSGPTFELLATNRLQDDPKAQVAYASPAISRGQIFLRTTTELWCIGRR